jgi:hypothetical protein
MLTTLLEQLRGAEPAKRLEALRTLTMLEETEALSVLGEMWKTEQNAEIKQAIGQAGKQIHAARQRGYTTIEGMAAAYRADLGPDEKDIEEKRKLAQIQTGINIENAKVHGNDESRSMSELTMRAATTSAIGMAFGLGAGAMMVGLTPPVNTSHNLSDGTTDDPAIGKQPIIPPRPSDTNINMWLKKLDNTDTAVRKQALLQLRDFNNPAALGALGTRFAVEPDADLKQLVQQIGKAIYFSTLFWQDHDPNRNEQKFSELRTKAQAAKDKRASQQ